MLYLYNNIAMDTALLDLQMYALTVWFKQAWEFLDFLSDFRLFCCPNLCFFICFQPILWHFCPFTLFPENAFSCLLKRLTICMAAKQAFSPLSTRGGGCHPLTDYTKSHENQKESDLSHLGNLKYGTSFVVILVKKKMGVPPSGRVK